MRVRNLMTGPTAAIVLATTAFASASAADVESLPGTEATEPAVARQCLSDLHSFEDEIARFGFGILPPGGYGTDGLYGEYYSVWSIQGTARQKMRALRGAAHVYAWDGDEQSCQRVLASMRTVYETHQELVGADIDDPNIRTAWRRAHLARAKPVAEMDHLMRADILIGSEIRNLEDEKLGEVEDVVLSPGKHEILYVLVSHGGFLGLAASWSPSGSTTFARPRTARFIC